MRRFYSHLQLCQLETILCNCTTRWLALVAGDVTGPRRPGWMRLQVRPLAVGANLPKHWRDGVKHWRDGQKALEGRTIDDQASEVLWVLSEICPTSAGVVSDQLRRYVVCILWVPRSGMEECIYMVPLHIYVIYLCNNTMIDDMTVSGSLILVQSSSDYKLINTKLFLLK